MDERQNAFLHKSNTFISGSDRLVVSEKGQNVFFKTMSRW